MTWSLSPSSEVGERARAVIRPARPDDADCCAEIAVAAWRPIFESWRELLGEELWRQNFADWATPPRL